MRALPGPSETRRILLPPCRVPRRGACVIGPELATEMPVPLDSGVHLMRVRRSLDGLVDECERLLRDDGLRETIGRAAEDYFDRYLALEQLGAYYIDTLWRTLQA
jgi:hypothetical protein